MIILQKELVHFSDGSGVTGDFPLDLKNWNLYFSVGSEVAGSGGAAWTGMSLRGYNNTTTSVTVASSDASGVTSDFPLDLKHWNWW